MKSYKNITLNLVIALLLTFGLSSCGSIKVTKGKTAILEGELHIVSVINRLKEIDDQLKNMEKSGKKSKKGSDQETEELTKEKDQLEGELEVARTESTVLLTPCVENDPRPICYQIPEPVIVIDDITPSPPCPDLTKDCGNYPALNLSFLLNLRKVYFKGEYLKMTFFNQDGIKVAETKRPVRGKMNSKEFDRYDVQWSEGTTANYTALKVKVEKVDRKGFRKVYAINANFGKRLR